MIELKKAQVRLEDCVYIICIVIDLAGQGHQWRGVRGGQLEIECPGS